MKPFLGPGSTDVPVDQETGTLTVPVPNKRLARMLQLGVHVERAAKLKQFRRRQQRQARRRNRSK